MIIVSARTASILIQTTVMDTSGIANTIGHMKILIEFKNAAITEDIELFFNSPVIGEALMPPLFQLNLPLNPLHLFLILVLSDRQVNLECGADMAVPHPVLDSPYIHSVLDGTCTERMPEVMASYIRKMFAVSVLEKGGSVFKKVIIPDDVPERSVYAAGIHQLSVKISEDEIRISVDRGLIVFVEIISSSIQFLKDFTHFFKHRDLSHAFFGLRVCDEIHAFTAQRDIIIESVIDVDSVIVEIDIVPAKPDELTAPYTCA